jgi:hypothetical protein
VGISQPVLARLRAAIVRRPAASAVVAVVAIAVVVGVFTSGGDEPPPKVTGTPAAAVTTVQSFTQAIASRDYAAVCDRLFTRRARAAAGGDNCQSVLAQAAARLRSPTVRITTVVLERGGKATVGVTAGLGGETPVADLIHLEGDRGRFRIDSVGDEARRGD